MTTVLEIITDAMQDAGIIADGETPTASEGQKGLRLLQRMLAADSTEDLMIYDNVSEVFNLVSGQQTYTIGTGGDFNTSRPVDITEAYMRDANGNDIPVTILTFEEYSEIISKPITSSLALGLYYNASAPLSEITLWPVVADSNYRLVLWSWKQLPEFTSLSNTITMPPGYEDYIEWNLAAKCCAAFNRPITEEIKYFAMDSKSKLKRINVNVPLLNIPLGQGASSSTFPISPSILTGV